jgi:hypothetical protein
MSTPSIPLVRKQKRKLGFLMGDGLQVAWMDINISGCQQENMELAMAKLMLRKNVIGVVQRKDRK